MHQIDQDLEGQDPEEPTEKPDITNVPWSVNDALLGVILLIPFSLVSMGSIFLFGFVVSLIASIYWFGFAHSFTTGIAVSSELKTIALGAATFISGIGLVWALGIKRRRGSLANLGVTNFKFLVDVPLAILGEILIFIGISTYAFVLNLFNANMPKQPVEALFGSSYLSLFLAVIFVAILAPIGEEVFFRGFVYTAFRRQWGVAVAVVASSGLFAVFHIVPLLYVPMFIIGVILAMLFEHRGSLVPNILLHGLNNFLALVVVYGQVIN